MRRSILTEKIARRGQHITREYSVDPFKLARVGEVMVREVHSLPASLSVPDAVRALESGDHRIYPVVDDANRPVGLVSRAEALLWNVEGGHQDETLGDMVSDASLPVAHPDDVVSRAVDVMLANDQGRLPVTDRQTGVLVGLLTRKNLLQVRAAEARQEDDRRAYFKPMRSAKT
jgi:CBS domain-containing protein